MDEIFLLTKMKIVRAIGEIPGPVRACIERINAVRNETAHSMFPENRRAYMAEGQRLYREEDIFIKEGIEKFNEDFEIARAHLSPRASG
jgi:hypothetical protein